MSAAIVKLTPYQHELLLNACKLATARFREFSDQARGSDDARGVVPKLKECQLEYETLERYLRDQWVPR